MDLSIRSSGKTYHMTDEDFFERVYQEFTEDDEAWEKKGAEIIRQYTLATAPEKAILNWLMVTLTGWTIPSLIERAGGQKPKEDPIAITLSQFKP